MMGDSALWRLGGTGDSLTDKGTPFVVGSEMKGELHAGPRLP